MRKGKGTRQRERLEQMGGELEKAQSALRGKTRMLARVLLDQVRVQIERLHEKSRIEIILPAVGWLDALAFLQLALIEVKIRASWADSAIWTYTSEPIEVVLPANVVIPLPDALAEIDQPYAETEPAPPPEEEEESLASMALNDPKNYRCVPERCSWCGEHLVNGRCPAAYCVDAGT